MANLKETTHQRVDATSKKDVNDPMAGMEKERISQLKGLDLLRFLLALSVTVFHYINFFTLSSCNDVKHCFPSYAYLHAMYTYGSHYAVPTFWLVSGIIFMKVYNEQVSGGRISLKQYALNRLSRLYPLHLVTLIIVAMLQNIFHYIYKRYFVFLNNTSRAFTENLLFIHTWQSSSTLSFNGPSWSVSAEILVYFVFFLLSFGQLFNSWPTTIAVWLASLYSANMNLIFASSYTNRCCALFFHGLSSHETSGHLKKQVFENVLHYIADYTVKARDYQPFESC